MVTNLLNQKKVFGFYTFDIAVISALVVALFLLESKLGYVIFAVLNFTILFTNLFSLKFNARYIFVLLALSMLLYTFYQLFDYKIEKAMSLILNYNHPSFNIRANFALASLYMMYQNPIIGVGINNFKFYLEDAIYGLESFQWLNIKTEGNIDGHSHLELNTYLYGESSIPDPANMILGFGAELGIIGLLVFLIFLSFIFFKSISQTRKTYLNQNEKILSQFLFYSLIIIIFSFSGFYQLYFILQWIILGLNICFFKYISDKYKKD
tara:strand:- start:391 stop:1188 length:798 start_codon:yes stop_codon:yes gene_type:complete